MHGFNAPPLETDRDRTGVTQKLSPRAVLERRIVWNLLAHMARHGFLPVEVSDGEGGSVALTALAVMEAVFDLDDAEIRFGTVTNTDAHLWVRFVAGNGIDCLPDWMVPKADLMGFDAAMTAFEVEDYA